MKLRETFELAQPVAAVWRFVEQPEAVAGCMPGVEKLTTVSADDIDVRITQSVGPMRATFAARVTIVERVPEKLIAFTAVGRSVRGAMGNVRATVGVELEAAGPGTVVTVAGDVALAGALGSVGQKVVAKQVGKVTAQFARNLEAALGGHPDRPAVGVTAEPAPVTGAPPAAVGTAAPASAQRAAGDPWARAAAALSAVSVVLSAVSVALGVAALRRASRRGRR